MKTSRTIRLLIIALSVLSVAAIVFAEDLQQRQPTASEIGRQVKCAVTKENFEINKDTAVIDYKGKSYYFCCPGCIYDFKKAPDKYTEGGEETPSQPAKDGIGK